MSFDPEPPPWVMWNLPPKKEETIWDSNRERRPVAHECEECGLTRHEDDVRNLTEEDDEADDFIVCKGCVKFYEDCDVCGCVEHVDDVIICGDTMCNSCGGETIEAERAEGHELVPVTRHPLSKKQTALP